MLDAMDEALTAGIVSEEAGAPGSFSFTHTLIREALYTSITAARRVRLHHRIASALEQQSSSFESRAAELAYHFGRRPYTRARTRRSSTPTRAGDRRRHGLAFEHAAHWYDMALRAMDFVGADTRNATATRLRAARETRTQLLRGRTVGSREERLRSGSEPARSRRAREAGRTARPPVRKRRSG